jgi:protein phosphatase
VADLADAHEGAGGEGMVVKPLAFIARGKGVLQPAIKCRGPENICASSTGRTTRCRNIWTGWASSGLAAKRDLRDSRWVEALDRFIRREPLRRVHECVFTVVALESKPVDPRL